MKLATAYKNTKLNATISVPGANGIYYEGSFRNDQPFQGTWFDKNGEAKLKVENGKQTNTD